MESRDWLDGWNPRYARVLAEVDRSTARAGLVDSNGDGRELWFGLDLCDPSGGWHRVVDWDDVGGHQPVERIDGTNVIFGWGTGKPRERRTVEHQGTTIPIRVGSNGWWLVLAALP